MKKWARAIYQPNLPLRGGERVTASPAHIALSRQAAREGMVLLKNDRDMLPLTPGSRVALFGKGSFDYVKGGGGSGDVTVAYVHNLYDGLKGENVAVYEPLADFYRDYVTSRYAAGDVPGLMAEPELPEELTVAARAEADVAVIVLSRFSGEGWDREPSFYLEPDYPWPDELRMPQKAKRIFPRGDFYLTDGERAMVERVCAAFDKVAVVLNVGGMVDVSWCKEDDRISTVLLAYQGGMEGGDAAAELLTGRASPCGKLPDTFAHDLTDYPFTEHFHDSPHHVDYTEDIYVGYRYFETLPGAAERVCYPFGFGLSYTAFTLEVLSAGVTDDRICVAVRVTNTGSRPGKEVAQLYYQAPWGLLQKPRRVLAAFHKTALLVPGESETAELSYAVDQMASFDDLGRVTPCAWVLEKGTYKFYLGASVRDTQELAYSYEQTESRVVSQLSGSLAPTHLGKRLLADGTYETLPTAQETGMADDLLQPLSAVQAEAVAPAARGRERWMLTKPFADGVQSLSAVAEGRLTLDGFIAQLSDEDLIHLLGGQPNVGVSNTFGIGDLPEYGVPNITTADGPAGLRLTPDTGICTTAWPCATLLAATWDETLVSRVGAAAAAEVKENNISVWLAPAVNIHRNPLCGRNFEYYSEGPLLAGKLAGAMVRGIQSQNVAATVKHFACNNKETNRKNSDSHVSQRALREVYLRVFEIIVREARPWAIMSSYNLINGRRASESRELLTDILRKEWGYAGMVMTDWWTRGEHHREILAGNDLKMANGYPERVREALRRGVVTRGDLEVCAKRVLETINGKEYYTRVMYVASATSTWIDEYKTKVYSTDAPQGTIFVAENNSPLETVQENGATCYKVDTSTKRTTNLNSNGEEYYGAFKVCIPADNVIDEGSFTIKAMGGVAQFNLYLAYNPAASEQSYIISDPGYTTCDAQGTFKWTTTEDLPETASLQVIKAGAGGAPLEGAEFTLTGDKGTSVSGTTDRNRQIVWTDLPADEKFTLTETAAPEGYQIVAPMNVTLTAGRTEYLTVTDDVEHGFTIKKVDAQNKGSLQGAVFRFEQIDGSYMTTGITGFDGTISFEGDELPYGSYRITEQTPPDGYVKSTRVETVEWDGTKDVLITRENIKAPNIVFSEEAYHTQFIDPYSWSNLVQLYKYMENTCLLIGLSITDPNLRRLLDISKRKNSSTQLRHYIIKKKPSVNDDFIRTQILLEEQDANSLGLNVFWIDNFDEIPDILKRISN